MVLLKKLFQVPLKEPESWPARINYELQSCPELSQGESKDEDEEWGCRCILFAQENGDNRAVFINVLFSVMIHDFAYCRGSQSRAWGPPGFAGGSPQENEESFNFTVIMRECIKKSVFSLGYPS